MTRGGQRRSVRSQPPAPRDRAPTTIASASKQFLPAGRCPRGRYLYGLKDGARGGAEAVSAKRKPVRRKIVRQSKRAASHHVVDLLVGPVAQRAAERPHGRGDGGADGARRSARIRSRSRRARRRGGASKRGRMAGFKDVGRSFDVFPVLGLPRSIRAASSDARPAARRPAASDSPQLGSASPRRAAALRAAIAVPSQRRQTYSGIRRWKSG